MKNLSLYLNVVVIIALGLLYYLHFTSDSNSEMVKPEDATSMILGNKEDVVVYIDFDTLLINYDYYEDLKNKLMAKRERLEAELNNKSKTFEKEVKKLEEKVSKGLITRANAQLEQQDLLDKEKDLYQLRDNLTRKLMDEERVMNNQLQYSILEYLEEHSKDKNYNYILSNTFGGALLYTNRGLNITKEVIAGINANYHSTKEEE